MGSQPGLSEAEREVLRVLWDHGPGTVRETNDVLCRVEAGTGLIPPWRPCSSGFRRSTT